MSKFNIRSFITILVLIGFVVFFANSVKAQEKKFYVGIGGSYQITNLNYEEVVDWDKNTWGVNAKFGYLFTPDTMFQFDVDYIPKIEGVYKPDTTLSGEVEVLTGIFSLKGYFPNSKPVKPFIIAGAGIMHYNVDLNDSARSLGYSVDDETSLCFKVGGGLDVFLNESVSIGLEGNYTAGIDKVEDVEYYNFILGANFYF